jgi:hypothetical protein
MTKTTKIVLITASILVVGSTLLIIYSSDKQKKKYNAAINTPEDALRIIDSVNKENNVPILITTTL